MTEINLFEELKAETIGSTVMIGNNIFHPETEEEIENAEKVFGFPFPSQLRNFYQKIGYGSLTTPHNPPKDYDFCNANDILPPFVAANFAKGILLWEGQHCWMAEETYELLEPGDLPFFEVGDSNYFLIIKPESYMPNAVYDMGGDLIEDSFEKFIWRLYYEDHSYYMKNW